MFFHNVWPFFSLIFLPITSYFRQSDRHRLRRTMQLCDLRSAPIDLVTVALERGLSSASSSAISNPPTASRRPVWSKSSVQLDHSPLPAGCVGPFHQRPRWPSVPKPDQELTYYIKYTSLWLTIKTKLYRNLNEKSSLIVITLWYF